MENKKLTMAVAGAGMRGAGYAECASLIPDKIEVVAVAETDPDKLRRFAEKHNIKPENCFNSVEDMLNADKLADVMALCTMDKQHYAQAIPALEKGYHLLLEKPASPDPFECKEIARVAKENDRQVVVCHVLRYTPFYSELKKIIESGKIGDVMCVQANEAVGYWHQAHSFVRGNWRNSVESSPMILQKCCHDMDILIWLIGKHVKSVSSFGERSHFRSECAPEGAPERCSEACPNYHTCPFSVEHVYLNRTDNWPSQVVMGDPTGTNQYTREEVAKALETSPYGRCVYHCDNDVVDHQVVNLLMEGGTNVTFNMSAFTYHMTRNIYVMGTKGDIVGNMRDNTITTRIFRGEEETIIPHGEDKFGHGGGDMGIIRDLVALLDPNDTSEKTSLTSIDTSVESHIVALAAEKSRLAGGELVKIDDYIASL